MVSAVPLQTESSVHKPPCYVDDSSPPVINKSLDYYLTKVNTSTGDITAEAKKRAQEMELKAVYCTEKEDSFLDIKSINAAMDSVSFLNDIYKNTTSFLRTIRTHYDILNKLSNYLEELRMTSKDVAAKSSLKTIQDTIFTCMCNIKTTLRSKNQDPTTVVPSGDLAEKFTQKHTIPISRCEQQNLEYNIIKDIIKYGDYIAMLYSLICQSLSVCR